MSTLEAVIDPEAFFEQRANDLSVVSAGLIVLLAAIINVAGTVLLFRGIFSAASELPDGVTAIMYATSVIGILVVSVVVWLLFAVAFHVFSTFVYDGDGSFVETLAVTGWGSLPKVFAAILSLVVVSYVVFVQGLATPDFSDPRAIQQYIQSIQTRPMFQLSTVGTIGATLWGGFIWISGVSEVQDIPERDAFVVVAIPVAISVLWTLYNLP
jgi:hypothetical protein